MTFVYLPENAPDGRTAYHIRFGAGSGEAPGEFDGPMELLLRRVRRGRTDPLALEVAAITGRFLEALEGLDETDLAAESDFVKLTTALLRIKARRMLPRLPPATIPVLPDLLADPAAALREGARYLRVSGHLRERLENRRAVWVRPPTPPPEGPPDAADPDPLGTRGPGPGGPPPLDLFAVVEAFRRVVERARSRPPVPVPQRQVPLSRMIRRMAEAVPPGTRRDFVEVLLEVVEERVSRPHLVAAFLAVLELTRRGRLVVLQEEMFGPISVEGRSREDAPGEGSRRRGRGRGTGGRRRQRGTDRRRGHRGTTPRRRQRDPGARSGRRCRGGARGDRRPGRRRARSEGGPAVIRFATPRPGGTPRPKPAAGDGAPAPDRIPGQGLGGAGTARDGSGSPGRRGSRRRRAAAGGRGGVALFPRRPGLAEGAGGRPPRRAGGGPRGGPRPASAAAAPPGRASGWPASPGGSSSPPGRSGGARSSGCCGPGGRARLSEAALETLSVIAYRQPITLPELNALRGVNSQGVVGTLLKRRLIRMRGRKKVVGRPLLYGTTPEFLERFGLDRLEDLPRLRELTDGETPAAAGVALPAAGEPPVPPRSTPKPQPRRGGGSG